MSIVVSVALLLAAADDGRVPVRYELVCLDCDGALDENVGGPKLALLAYTVATMPHLLKALHAVL